MTHSPEAEYQEQLEQIARLVRGEFHLDLETRQQAAVDGSIFTILPQAVLYPKDAGDVQAVLHYLWMQSQAGKPTISVTPRGKGSDQAGGPLGAGIVMDFTRHMNQILEFGDDFVRVEPGVRYGELQKELKARGRYLPPYPASLEICTVGGAVANNSSGEKAVKYGDTRTWVNRLKTVLASGDEAELRPLSAAELEAKQRQRSFEGHVYREAHKLLQSHPRAHELPGFHTTKNSTGYSVWEVEKYGHFDLAKLFVGSQGTLGILTEIVLRTSPYPKQFALIAGYFESIDQAALATGQLLALEPSALEIVDKNLLTLVQERQPGHLKGLLPKKLPEIVLLVEFDNANLAQRSNKAKAARTILGKYAFEHREETDPVEQERLWRLRRSAAAVLWTVQTPEKALPIVEDGVVPPELLPEFFKQAYALFAKYGLKVAVWGHAGDANLHMQPFLDVGKEEDRAKIWPLVEEFHALVIGMGGCISAEHNDGLLRSPYLQQQYGEELYGIFREIKHIFDPQGFLNPGKKVDVDLELSKTMLRESYGLEHLIQDAEQINR